MADFISRKLGHIFSDKYVHADINIVQLLMYRSAYPVAALLNRFDLSPNQITTASLLCSLFAFLALIFDPGWAWFCLFWGLSVLLDFCDGTVARMAGKVSKTAFRYDHMSDLVKISLVILGVGIRYNEILVWVLAFSAAFCFLYADALNRELGVALARQAAAAGGGAAGAAGTPRERNSMIARAAKHKLLRLAYRNFRAVFLTVNGHTLLLFFVFPFGREPAIWGFSYLILVELLAVRARIARLVKMRR